MVLDSATQTPSYIRYHPLNEILMSHSTLLFLIGCLLAAPVVAQKPADVKRNGEKAFENGQWAVALSLLNQYQETKPGDLSVLTKLGIVHYQLGHGAEARKYLEYVTAKSPNNRDPNLYYYLARTLHGLSDWEKAIVWYKTFLRVCGEKHSLRENAADQIRRCVQGMQIPENPEIALVENLGTSVNTPGDEFAPLPSVNHPDRLYFAAARAGCNGGLRNNIGYEDAQKGHWSSDMFVAQLNSSGWESAGNLGGLLNSSRFEVPLGFNANGQVLYFFRGFTTYSGEILADTATKKDEYALLPPTFHSPVNAAEGDCYPFFFNERTIVFSSRRPGGLGGLDLWFTTFTDTAWSEPTHLGSDINSAYDETTPFLANDGRSLFFSSNRPEGMGGLDVYTSHFDDKKAKWGKAVNMGTPINAPEDDAFYRLSSDGRTAFFSSNRLGGIGERDLYIAYLKEASIAQTTRSNPELFSRVKPDQVPVDATRQAVIPALLYENDLDLLSSAHLEIVDQITSLARENATASVFLTVFTDDSGQSKFDLYYGIKRAEILGKALTDRGVPSARVFLRSVGSAYPLARTILEGAENPAGKRLNQRVEPAFSSIEPLAFTIRLKRPSVPETMAAEGTKQLDEQWSGLAYRVEVAVTRQLLNNDALSMFGDLMIESQPGSGQYRYTAGYFKRHEKAVKSSRELQGLGFTAARVIAYVNSISVSKAEAVGLVKKYPDLAAFIKG